MSVINVFGHSTGSIYLKKYERKDGLCVCVENSGYSSNHPQIGHFIQAAFDSNGSRFLICDHLGHLFHFDLLRQRYDHLMQSRLSCTALNYSLLDKNAFLMALVDNTVRCYRLGQTDQVAVLRGHNAAVVGISVHCSGRYALTTDPDITYLWDLTTFERMRRLNVREDVQLISVQFVPTANLIVTAFRDDTVFVWQSESLHCERTLIVPSEPRYRTFACSSDGTLLVAAGRSKQIHLWDLASGQLLKNFQLPDSSTGGSIRQVGFMNNETILVLTHSGFLKIISVSTAAVRSELPDFDISKFCVSSDDKIAVVSNGQLKLYNLRTVLNPPVRHNVINLKSTTTNDPPPQIVTDRSDSSKGKKTYRLSCSKRTAPSPTVLLPQKMKQPEPLDRKKLRIVLLEHGQFPAKYRLLIWKTLLQLPGNTNAYTTLFDKGVHPAFECLEAKYPLKSQKLLRSMQRVLSCVAYWSPLFGEADYLPLLAFPFIRLFQNNLLLGCETVMSILLNWTGLWFEYFPNPPLNVLGMVENVIGYHDKELYNYLCSRSVTSEVFAWSLLQTVFTEVLTRESWLALWDHLLCHPPGHLLYCVAVFTLLNKHPLMRMTELREFQVFYRHAGTLNVRDIIKHAKHIRSSTPKEICPCRLMGNYVPLSQASGSNTTYPAFNRYPVYIVDYQVRERARLREEEKAYLEERKAAELAAKRAAAAQAAAESWSRQQEQLLQAESRRREMLQGEQARLLEQRTRLAALQRETKLSELQTLQTARLRMSELEARQQEAELRRLDDQLAASRRADTMKFNNELKAPRVVSSGEHYTRRNNHPDDTVAAAALSDIDSVCVDNSRLEEEVGALLKKLQRARLQVPRDDSPFSDEEASDTVSLSITDSLS